MHAPDIALAVGDVILRVCDEPFAAGDGDPRHDDDNEDNASDDGRRRWNGRTYCAHVHSWQG